MQAENHDNKVVSIFDRNKNSRSSLRSEKPQADSSYDFEAIMRRNQENKNRLQQERSKANRGVIRSYRLKN